MKPGIKYGFIDGAGGIVWTLLMFISGLSRNDYAGWISILAISIPIFCCIEAVNEFRRKEGNGWVTFGQAFKQSFLVILIGATISSIFYAIYAKYIDPTLMDFNMNKQVVAMQEKGLSEELILQRVNYIATFQTPGWLIIFGMLFGLFIGSVIALIVAGVMKKPNPEEIA